MTSNIALFLFALSQRPSEHPGSFTRVGRRDLHGLTRTVFGPNLRFYTEVDAFSSEHPEAVFPDPGMIGNDLTIYLAHDWSAWADVFPGMDYDDALIAAREAGWDDVPPIQAARALPARLLAVAA